MEDKIKISTKEELLSIKKKGNYILMNDIDLEEHGESLIDKFEGQFDGQGHTIRNFKIVGQGANTGLFNAVTGENAKISNLVIENATCYSYGGKKCGIITGFLFDGATIENCTVKSSDTIARYPYEAGIICGVMNDYDTKHPTYIRNCNVTGCTTGASAIVGRVYYSVVENCEVDNCELTTHFAGLVFDAMKSRIENCFIKNSKLFDKSGIIIYKSSNTKIINTELIVPPVVTNEMLMRSILESADSYEQLKDREEISLWGVYTDEPVDFPEVITKLTKLKKLNIGNNSWRTIPDSISNLQNLEEMQLDCALSYLDTLPDLSALPKLKTLRANGNVWHSKHPFPKQSLLPQILKATQVEVLDISKWGERVRQAKVVRPQLDMELFTGLKTFKNLQILSLSGHTFESLPKVLKSLNP